MKHELERLIRETNADRIHVTLGLYSPNQNCHECSSIAEIESTFEPQQYLGYAYITYSDCVHLDLLPDSKGTF